MLNNIHKKISPNMASVVHFSPFDGQRVSSANPKKKPASPNWKHCRQQFISSSNDDLCL